MEFTGQTGGGKVSPPKMMKLSERTDEQRLTVLFVGQHHTGKTCAAASFPRPLHVEDFDGKIDGAKVPFLDISDITYNYWAPKDPQLIPLLNARFTEMLNINQLQGFGNQPLRLPKTYVTDSLTNQTYAFLNQSIELTHPDAEHGRWLGPQRMAGPDDYNLQSQATYDYLAFLFTLKIQNIIVTGHLVDLYDFDEDEKGKKLPYAPRVVVGEKLSLTDKMAANLPTKFSHIFRFSKSPDERYFVQFRGGIACTTFPWLPTGKQDWTGRNFYEFLFSFKKKWEEQQKGATAAK